MAGAEGLEPSARGFGGAVVYAFHGIFMARWRGYWAFSENARKADDDIVMLSDFSDAVSGLFSARNGLKNCAA